MIVSFRGDFDFLSNMYLTNINYKGKLFKSVENAYQWMKCRDDKIWSEKCLTYAPHKIKIESKKLDYDKQWFDFNKLLIMEELLRIKFNDDDLMFKLLITKNQNIIEGNFWGDRFWGVDLGVNPNLGENHLGRLLMKIRDEVNNNI